MTTDTEALPPLPDPEWEIFKAWALENRFAYPDKNGLWSMPSHSLDNLWCGWQARAALAQRQQVPDEFETRADGKVVRRDRWEWGIRRIVALLWGNRHEFEIDEVVEAVRAIAPSPNEDDESLVQAVNALTAAPQAAQAQPQEPGK